MTRKAAKPITLNALDVVVGDQVMRQIFDGDKLRRPFHRVTRIEESGRQVVVSFEDGARQVVGRGAMLVVKPKGKR